MKDRVLHDIETAAKRILRNEPLGEEYERYRRTLTTLHSIGAMTVHAPVRGRVAVVDNCVAFKQCDNHTLANFSDLGYEGLVVKGFTWVKVPTVVGPREVVAPRIHPRQKNLRGRIRNWYERKGRAKEQLEAVELAFTMQDLQEIAPPQRWGSYGVAPVAPSSTLTHRHYKVPLWFLLSPDVARRCSCC